MASTTTRGDRVGRFVGCADCHSFLVYFSLLSLLALKEEAYAGQPTVVERKVIGGVWVIAPRRPRWKKSGATRQRAFAWDGLRQGCDVAARGHLRRGHPRLPVFIPARNCRAATSGMVIAGS